MNVSVIIPLRNEEKYIEKCMASILYQEYPKDRLEVIFVDGRSEDCTKEIIQHYARQYPFIHLVDNPDRIVPAAMNIGIATAKGELIVRMDAHAEYAPDYISKCVEWSQKTGAENVGGPMRAEGKGYVGKAIQFTHHSIFGLGGGKFHDERFSGKVDTVYLGAFKREVFDRVGLYDTRLVRNQDIELNSRIRAAGGTCFLSPEIRSKYFNRSSLTSLWRQNFQNGLWSIYTVKITKAALSVRHFVPLIFVLSLLMALFASIIGQFAIADAVISNIGRNLFLACLGLYLIAAVFFSAKIAIKEGLHYFTILPVVFFILHFSYGIGSIKGLLTVKKWVSARRVAYE